MDTPPNPERKYVLYSCSSRAIQFPHDIIYVVYTIYVRVCVHIHTQIHTKTRIHEYGTSMFVRACVRVCVCVCVYIYVHAYIIYAYTFTYTYTIVYVIYIYALLNSGGKKESPTMCVCVCRTGGVPVLELDVRINMSLFTKNSEKRPENTVKL
jgi:hypothetical protein